MEKLDIVFAQRYLDAYFAYKQEEPVTAAWQKAFDLSTCYWAIVLQHLLVGINAHINLDLGIAAATISTPNNIHDLKNDFDTINEILSGLVEEVENSLATIWPSLKRILQKTRKVDDFLVDFSMEIARDGAWTFAQEIVSQPPQDLERLIAERDEKVAKKEA